MDPTLTALTVLGSILASAITGCGVHLVSERYKRRKRARAEESSVAIAKLTNGAAQRKERRDELKEARKECEEWRAKYYALLIEHTRTELLNVQLKGRIDALEKGKDEHR
jgi:hypothetical protein